MYVTPERFRTMGLGVDLEVEDVELRSTLTRASAAVDSYCAVSSLPQRHDFRGGTITGEQHEWRTSMYDGGVKPLRFYPWHGPVRTVTDIRIYSTPQIYTQIDPVEAFINNSGGYIEISSLKLTQYGIFGTGLINAITGMWNPVAVLDYTYGYRFSTTTEYLEATDALTYRAQNQWWASDPAPVIYLDEAEEPSGFTISYDEGTVTFDTPQPAGTVVTASYTYRLPNEIAEATALIAADDFGESRMRARGMSGVDTLRVGEIEIRRSRPNSTNSRTDVQQYSSKIQSLLSGYVQMTVR